MVGCQKTVLLQLRVTCPCSFGLNATLIFSLIIKIIIIITTSTTTTKASSTLAKTATIVCFLATTVSRPVWTRLNTVVVAVAAATGGRGDGDDDDD